MGGGVGRGKGERRRVNFKIFRLPSNLLFRTLWTEEHTKAFNEVKNQLPKPPILAHYDVSRPMKIRTDGSKLNGINVILSQLHDNVWKPVAFASRYLSKTEQNYHNIEIELLAITWGCEKMNKYLHGLYNFIIETDHKPLIPILNYKPLIEMTPRIQRMRMRLLKFNMKAEYVKGAHIKDADALSRAPNSKLNHEDEIAEQEIEFYVNSIVQNFPASKSLLDEIKKETSDDPTLSKLKEYIMTGWPSHIKVCQNNVKPYWKHKHDLL